MQKNIGDSVQAKRLWYSLNYNINIIMAVEGDMDVRMMFKGYDERRYLYVGGKDNLGHRLSKGGEQLRGRQGLMMKVYDVEQLTDRVMVVLKIRYKQVAHTGQGNGM